MGIRAHLTAPAANPRHLALSYVGCAAMMLVPVIWLVRLQPAGWTPLLIGVGLLPVAFLIFAHASWNGESIRWSGRARWGIAVALLGAAALLLPM